MRHRRVLIAFAVAALAAAGRAQLVGSQLPEEIELEDFRQTEAESYDDLLGRTVLLEFFAYW